MTIFLLVFLVIALMFGFVIIFGAPYVPTLKEQRNAALELLNLNPGQKLYDLGCGDGSLLIMAASRGLNVVGYELNPILAAIAWLRTRKYRKQVKIVWGNLWRADISEADGIFVFLLGRFMGRLDNLIKNQCKTKPVNLASYAFQIPGKKETVKQSGVFLYSYRPIAQR